MRDHLRKSWDLGRSWVAYPDHSNDILTLSEVETITATSHFLGSLTRRGDRGEETGSPKINVQPQLAAPCAYPNGNFNFQWCQSAI